MSDYDYRFDADSDIVDVIKRKALKELEDYIDEYFNILIKNCG